MQELVNGDRVRITRGPAAGLVGLVGATYPDGRVEVVMPDLMGPASADEEAFSPDDLALVTDDAE